MSIVTKLEQPDDQLPNPLTPEDCDLRAMEWFPFHFKLLSRSQFWLHASDQAKVISIDLWCAAYEEVPAASLPDDDVALSEAAGFGRRGVEEWLKVKDEVMAPWVKCLDGRYYHRTLAGVALGTYFQKLRDSARKNTEAGLKKKKLFLKLVDQGILANYPEIEEKFLEDIGKFRELISNSMELKHTPHHTTPQHNTPLTPQAGDGVSRDGFSIKGFLGEGDLDAARRAAPKWDIHRLMEIYDEAVRNGERDPPKHPKSAFPAWCSRYTKGKPP